MIRKAGWDGLKGSCRGVVLQRGEVGLSTGRAGCRQARQSKRIFGKLSFRRIPESGKFGELAYNPHRGDEFFSYPERSYARSGVGLEPSKSVARFPLVSERQDIHGIGGWLVAVQGYIAGIPEVDDQLAQLGHFRERPANAGGCFQQEELPLYGPASPSGGLWGSGGEKLPASLQAVCRTFGDNYLWHSGTIFSSSVPQAFNQARTSGPVRCRPVS